MKYFIVIIATVMITASFTLPDRPASNVVVNNAVDLYHKRESGQTIEIAKEKEKISLSDLVTKEENDRLWGKIGTKRFMIYKDLDFYVYVDGYMHQTKTKWSGDNFLLAEKDFVELFQLDRIKADLYSVVNQKPTQLCLNTPDEEDIYEKLEGMEAPIEGAVITRMEGQLPGADRSYRNGFHEGFDWYSGAIGVEINLDTEITPMYEGKVVRIDKHYVELEEDVRNQILEDEATVENKKYQKNLDALRGRQVWIQSENGVLVRYAHLSSVNESLNVGEFVTFEDILGTTGNSGTSNGVLETEGDIHLHSDILVCGKNFWEFGNVSEMNEQIIQMLETE